ncbi:MAG: hypothetical protein EORIYHIE_002233, partial [Candidatus Fervidibacter sp.]
MCVPSAGHCKGSCWREERFCEGATELRQCEAVVASAPSIVQQICKQDKP